MQQQIFCKYVIIRALIKIQELLDYIRENILSIVFILQINNIGAVLLIFSLSGTSTETYSNGIKFRQHLGIKYVKLAPIIYNGNRISEVISNNGFGGHSLKTVRMR